MSPSFHGITRGMRIHFMGVSGIGVSGLAAICRERGCVVSGCDPKLNGVARRLEAQGATVSVGHDARHVDGPIELLVHSSAVSAREPELLEARARGIRTMSRGELLAALAADRPLIAVAGAHGKTTTSGMASQLLIQAGWDPTVVVGGVMVSLGTNARSGAGAYLVAETDESDGSFLLLAPHIAIVTNIDREHLNHYRTFERLVEAFEQFVGHLAPGGVLIACADDAVVREALYSPGRITYGLEPGADVTAERIRLHGDGSSFQAVYNGRSLGPFTLQVPGRHNVLNALAVISLGLTLEIPLITAREALAGFEGTKRRFQRLRLPRDIWLVEDYAHHPSEILATLDADVVRDRHRLVVFQPHRFSRTQLLERELSVCFDHADGVIVTDIYPAFESPIPDVSGERLARLIKAHGHPCVRYVPREELTSFVRCIAQPGDTIFFLGAGDIGEMCHDLAARLHSTA
ncbi:MAG: UDP-N-acetylmuramate--L-alanine ligase [Candidatus Omnitrophica bacterium]|nr:UDP-N-acetylmuramate--L-alanine ligase [Candidatus Omnitrophota bacterium]